MKRILTITVASLAVAAVADFSPQIGVTTLDLTQKNNIIPVQFTSLASTANVSADALVCTNNIPLNSYLFVYQNNSYSAWQLQQTGWVGIAISSDIDGIKEASAGASSMGLSVGSAIWLSFPDGNSTRRVSVYGQVAQSASSTIVAGKCNLLANPTASSVDVIAKIGANAQAGDVIRLVDSVEQISRNKTGTKWGKFNPTTGGIDEVTSLSVSPYQGFWYYSKGSSNITINWN